MLAPIAPTRAERMYEVKTVRQPACRRPGERLEDHHRGRRRALYRGDRRLRAGPCRRGLCRRPRVSAAGSRPASWSPGLCTSVLTSELVGMLGVSIEDRFWFTGPVFYGDTITIDVWIAERLPESRTLVWEASARNEQGLEVLKARATLKFPRPKPSRQSCPIPKCHIADAASSRGVVVATVLPFSQGRRHRLGGLRARCWTTAPARRASPPYSSTGMPARARR